MCFGEISDDELTQNSFLCQARAQEHLFELSKNCKKSEQMQLAKQVSLFYKAARNEKKHA